MSFVFQFLYMVNFFTSSKKVKNKLGGPQIKDIDSLNRPNNYVLKSFRRFVKKHNPFQLWKSKTRVTSSNPRVKRLKEQFARLKAWVEWLKGRVSRLKARVEAIKPRVK